MAHSAVQKGIALEMLAGGLPTEVTDIPGTHRLAITLGAPGASCIDMQVPKCTCMGSH